eukprot:ANDGO_01131.mRNA.1 EKC/KEOPS complex subunit CGI121
MKLFKVESHPAYDFYVYHFENVLNAESLLQSIREAKLDAAFMDARYVLSEFHLLCALNRAISNFEHGKMKTKSLHAELVYCLSPSTSIAQSLSIFGIQATSRSVLVGIFNPANEKYVDSIISQVHGAQMVPITVGGAADTTLISSFLKLPPTTQFQNLESQLVTRISTKEMQ